MYRYGYTSYRKILIAGIVLLTAAAIAACFIGRFQIMPSDIAKLVTRQAVSDGDVKRHILFDIRLPRVILSIMVGAALALAGTAMQGILQNPLASPDVLGTASASGFGAAVGILFFGNNIFATLILSFTAGLLSIFLVVALCRLKKDFSVLSIVLSGIIISSLFVSMLSILKFAADPNDTLPAITFWLMGSFASSGSAHITFILIPFLVGTGMLYVLRWKLNILSLGDDEAKIAGVHPKLVKSIVLGAATVLIASAVTVSGMIGWVGLVIPHATRKIIGSNHGYVLPLSSVFGALFMLLSDTFARTIGFSEIPIGIITSLTGAPLFALLFLFKDASVHE